MAVLEPAWRPDQVDWRGPKHRLRIRRAERSQPAERLHDVSRDVAQAKRRVDAQPRHEILRTEPLVGARSQPPPKLVEARRVERQPGCQPMSAEPQEDTRAFLERREQVERSDAAARARGDAVRDREHERRLVVRLDELRRDDADDTAMPVVTGHDQHVVPADARVAVNRSSAPRPESRLPAPGAGCSLPTTGGPGRAHASGSQRPARAEGAGPATGPATASGRRR